MEDSGHRIFLKLGAILLVYLGLTLHWREAEPVDNIDCTLLGRDGQAPIMLGNLRAPISRIELTGLIDDPSKSLIYNYRGQAIVSIEGRQIETEAHGSIAVGKAYEIDGMAIFSPPGDFGPDGLSLATLDVSGLLATDRTQAFAFTNREFKLSHPMDYSCNLDILPARRGSEGH